MGGWVGAWVRGCVVCDCAWLCVAMCGYAWLCVAMRGSSESSGQCRLVCGCVSQRLQAALLARHGPAAGRHLAHQHKHGRRCR